MLSNDSLFVERCSFIDLSSGKFYLFGEDTVLFVIRDKFSLAPINISKDFFEKVEIEFDINSFDSEDFAKRIEKLFCRAKKIRKNILVSCVSGGERSIIIENLAKSCGFQGVANQLGKTSSQITSKKNSSAILDKVGSLIDRTCSKE